jgi:hypothetical protein
MRGFDLLQLAVKLVVCGIGDGGGHLDVVAPVMLPQLLDQAQVVVAWLAQEGDSIT